VSYVLIDHGLTPSSPVDEIDEWISRIMAMLADRPGDEGLRATLRHLEHLRALAQRQKTGE